MMNRLNTRPAWLLLFIILAGSTIGMSSGCATALEPALPTATVRAATPTAVPSPTPQPSPQLFAVGNTDSQGAFLRRTPIGERIKAWLDGAIMTAVGGDQIVEGNSWRNVRDPEGNEGWMLIDYLVPQDLTPVPPLETPTATSSPTSATASPS